MIFSSRESGILWIPFWRVAVGLLIVAPISLEAREIEFNRDVRPILSDKCFACHGPDAKTREAELRLDQREIAVAGRGDRAAIVPGNSMSSQVIERIISTDDLVRMPPPEAGPPLAASEIEILKQWIDQGAQFEDHWSYIPPVRPEVPVVPGENSGEIDRFIRQKQIEAGIEMSGRADRRTLLRRLSFDLVGLPPTPEEAQEFLQDDSPQAYEKAVDRFLASPHFGERMAIYWLDLVRYADTLGYHGDQVRSVSPYRDYVIEAFNSNKPFDQFTTEQIAGDLLPNATLWQKVASTYNRLNRASGEGGVQPKEYLAKYSADRVRTAGAVWLGSTFGCSECHDHKFDPFTTKDFYSFAAFFADIKEQGIVQGARHIEQMPVPTPEQAQRQQELNSKIEATAAQFQRSTPELQAAFETWKQEARRAAERWVVAEPVAVTSANGATLKIEAGNVITATGANPDKDVYLVELSTKLPTIGALRLEVLRHDSLPAKGPGRAGNGNFVVHKVDVEVDGQKLEWASANATHSQTSHPAENIVTGEANGWAILPKVGEDHQLILEGKTSISFSEKVQDGSQDLPTNRVKVSIVQNHGSGHSLGRFRILLASTTATAANSPIPSAEVTNLLRIPDGERSEEQNAVLQAAFRDQTPLLKSVREQLSALRKEKTELDASILTTLVSVSTTPREIRILPRGDWMNDSGEVVQPSYPEFLTNKEHVPQQERLNRLDLAKWLTSPENPLVARTYVNRLWMLFFGYGLSRSVDDLGSQGEWPSHPELLDWLAVEFMEAGWDTKHVIKLMLMSKTYQQTSVVDPVTYAQDPYNRLFARQTKWRLDAEMVRDNALAVSGLLVKTIGGPSAKPYQPAGYWSQLNFPKRVYQHDQNENQYRRGLYTHWQRTFLHPSLLAFDAPPREECTARRERSNTPLQALVLLNDPTYVESARVFAAHVCASAGPDFQSRLNYAFQRCLARQPTAEELIVLKQLYEQDLKRFTGNQSLIDPLLSTGLASSDDVVDKITVAAWTSVTRVLLNLHETIMRY